MHALVHGHTIQQEKNSKLDEMKMQQKKEVPDVILKFNKLVLPPVVAKQ